MSVKAVTVKTPARRRQRHDDDHEAHRGGHERWLVTYADMVTLLMVLFIVMFAMSTVDQHKFDQLRNGLANAFGASPSILNGSNALANDQGASSSQAMFTQIVNQFPKPEQPAVTSALHQAADAQAKQRVDAASSQVSRLMKIWKQIHGALQHQGLADDVQATIDQRGLVISLVSRHVVFGYDVATLTDRGNSVVDTITPVLAKLPEPIEVDGHTNQEHVHPKYFPTDWELSVARAVTVLRRMQEVDGIPAGRLEATGFGHTKPLMDPRKPGSQEINKRVDIVVLSQAPAETRALFQKVYTELENHS